MYDTPIDWEEPDWENPGIVHEWKNYIIYDVMDMWDTFTGVQKQAISKQAEKQACLENWD